MPTRRRGKRDYSRRFAFTARPFQFSPDEAKMAPRRDKHSENNSRPPAGGFCFFPRAPFLLHTIGYWVHVCRVADRVDRSSARHHHKRISDMDAGSLDLRSLPQQEVRDCQNAAQDQPKTARKRPKRRQKGPKRAPRRAQKGPKKGNMNRQFEPSARRSPQEAPRGLREAPRGPQ